MAHNTPNKVPPPIPKGVSPHLPIEEDCCHCNLMGVSKAPHIFKSGIYQFTSMKIK
jgi:hypothetical protein